MWQAFTEPTRTAILQAQQEAAKTNNADVGPDHLLLGLLRDEQTVAAQVLKSFGVSYEKVVSILNQNENDEAGPPAEELKLRTESKRVLERAAEAAYKLRHNEIGTGHLLLALLPDKPSLWTMLIGERYGVATGPLRELGVDFTQLRSRIEENLYLEISQQENKDS